MALIDGTEVSTATIRGEDLVSMVYSSSFSVQERSGTNVRCGMEEENMNRDILRPPEFVSVVEVSS